MGTIVLQTRKGTSITNTQSATLSPFTINQMPALAARYKDVQVRADPSGMYDCHGLTFASRRTCIDDASDIRRILADDGYERIALNKVHPGDVILYVAGNGDIEHSGIVVSKPEAADLNVPLVYSKWGNFWEVIHRANYCPYDWSSLEFYRVVK